MMVTMTMMTMMMAEGEEVMKRTHHINAFNRIASMDRPRSVKARHQHQVAILATRRAQGLGQNAPVNELASTAAALAGSLAARGVRSLGSDVGGAQTTEPQPVLLTGGEYILKVVSVSVLQRD